jgi:polyferredoxin
MREALQRGLQRLQTEARALFLLDAPFPDGVLAGPELRARRRRIEWMRRSVQWMLLLTVAVIGVEFSRWVRGLEHGVLVGERPPGVEGFLPIAALLSLRHLLSTGEFHPVHPAGLVLLLLALSLAFLAKKAFCSWICPVGTLVEALASASQRVFGKRLALPRFLDIPLRAVKYLLLAFFVGTVFWFMSATAVEDFLDSPYNRVADVKMLYFFAHLSPTAGIVLAVLGVLSFVIPNFWCRYLCPYGALLGLVSLLSPLKITRHASSCIDCGLCAKACPSLLPVDHLRRVRSDECIGCLTCVAACPVPRALQMQGPKLWPKAVRPGLFALGVVAILVGGTFVARVVGLWANDISDAEYARRR